MSELTQALVGVDIALGVILVFRVIGVVLNERASEAALKRFEQELRDHPPSTATVSRTYLSGKGEI